MPNKSINDLSLKELKQLQRDIEKAITSFADRHKSEARAKLEEQARSLGFTLAELMGLEGKKQRAPVQAKYAHPQNPEATWSGRGRRPQWFIDAVASGKSPEDLAI